MNATTDLEPIRFSPTLNRKPLSKVYIHPMVLSSKAVLRILCVSNVFVSTFK